MLRFLLLVSAAVFASSSVVRPRRMAQYSPVGECPGHQEGNPTFLPDSENCQLYYECSDGLPIQNHCADGLEWNPTLNTCDFPEHANCQAGKPKEKPKIIVPFSPVGECPEHQGQYPVYLPDSDNCSIFYECIVNGVPVQLSCQPGLEFNPILHVCDYPESAGCTAGKPKETLKTIVPFSPVGECPEHQGQYPVYLPDSKNCSIFYECDVNGNPLPLSCQPGLEFNPTLHVCDYPDSAGCTAGKPKETLKTIVPFSPVGECPEHQGQYPVYLPDSNNCSIFYECIINGVPVPLSCQPGLEFNPTLHVCDFPESAGCTAGKPKETLKTIDTFSPVGECPEHQGDYPVYLPDSKNCSIFYECDRYGNPIALSCQPGLEFNPILHVCDWPNSAGCTAESGRVRKPYAIVGQCPEHDGQYPVYLPDDEDCSAFYECSNGLPNKLHCAPGTLFDSVTKVCRMASEAVCQTRI